ncbi:DNA glycosylase [Rhizoclosmatium globosum]|uniref:DNA glycosylase n=1 Tax=Rhizoclosmatium globosum TaxID=329046 RepID=A0A1Y2CMJ2_9FUNG|nr:DNA glycosylase [Rhizoclosmatium globosum]|eukprot:ORY48223.1 DNA glycosylase [Rhizoclosmatium globosum]
MSLATSFAAKFAYSGIDAAENVVAPPKTPPAKTKANASKAIKAEPVDESDQVQLQLQLELDQGESSSVRRSARKRTIVKVEVKDEGGDAEDNENVKDDDRTTKPSPPGKNVVQFPHLKEISDSIDKNLICLFVGINPGVKTSETGHAYAHSSNWFWKLLHSGGCTDRLLPYTYDTHLPRLYSLGTTNLVARPTANQTQLSQQEKIDGAPILAAKIRKWKPESVCFVGKDIWKVFHKKYFGCEMNEKGFEFGFQKMAATGADLLIGNKKSDGTDDDPEFANPDWKGARVFVSFSTSGLVSFPPEFKKQVWTKLGAFVNERREARGETSPKVPFVLEA